MQELRGNTISFDGSDLTREHDEPTEERQSSQSLHIGKRVVPHHHIDPECGAYECSQIGGHHHRFGQSGRQPWQEDKQQQHHKRQAFGADVVQQIVRCIAEHANADERQAGHGQQNGQDDYTEHEMRNLITAVRVGFGVVMPQALQPFGGHQLGDGEVADDDDARAGQNQRGVEHACRECGAVAQLGEIVVIPVWIVGGHAGGNHAGDDEERQQAGDGFGIHHLRLHEGHIPHHAGEGRADAGKIAGEQCLAHHVTGRADQGERRQEDGRGVYHRQSDDFEHATNRREPTVFEVQRA